LFSVFLVAVLASGALAPGAGPRGAYAQAAITSKIDPVLQQQMVVDGSRMLPVIVEMAPPPLPFPLHPKVERAERALDLLRFYGEPVGALPIVNGAAGFANAAGIGLISLAPGVAYVHEDAVVRPRRSQEPRTFYPPGQLSAPYPRVVSADRAWDYGTTGKQVGVAVLDSGVAPDPDLTQPTNRLVVGANFAGPRGSVADPGGHGTHVAGIVAGNGARSGGEYVGVAPDARVIDVRVLNRNGNGRVSSIAAGIQWVIVNRALYNIRVINLSLGAPARQSYRTDPLAAAVEIAWKRGLVVVVAAGNDGPQQGTVQTPGTDPYVITVGATDDLGSVSVSDDELAWFSAWGTTYGSASKPDLVAPGRRIVSIRTPGSYLDALYANRVVLAKNGSTYFRLTGTSMSAPMVAGAAALLLERQPGLTPDQVKAILTGAIQAYGQASATALPDPSADGAGLLDAYAAATSPTRGAANGGLRPSNGLARALYPVLYGQPLVWKDPSRGLTCWSCLFWGTLGWDDGAWDNLNWDAFNWSDGAWDDGAWDDGAWDDGAWDRAGWDSLAWDSLTLD
jgi:serine protease AprX